MIKVLRSPKYFTLYLRRQTCGFVLKFLWELGVEVRPRQVSVLACVVLAGTSEGTNESKSSSVNSL